MPPNVSPILTPSEKQIMDVLWRLKSASVQEVHRELNIQSGKAYNTVLSTLRTMATKGYVKHHKEQRAFIYSPTISEFQARDKAINNLLARFFEGSPQLFAQHLLGDRQPEKSDLNALMEEIIAAEKEGKSG